MVCLACIFHTFIRRFSLLVAYQIIQYEVITTFSLSATNCATVILAVLFTQFERIKDTAKMAVAQLAINVYEKCRLDSRLRGNDIQEESVLINWD